jgi:hypothetical protein
LQVAINSINSLSHQCIGKVHVSKVGRHLGMLILISVIYFRIRLNLQISYNFFFNLKTFQVLKSFLFYHICFVFTSVLVPVLLQRVSVPPRPNIPIKFCKVGWSQIFNVVFYLGYTYTYSNVSINFESKSVSIQPYFN